MRLWLWPDLIWARVSGPTSCLLIIKPLLFPGLDGCASVALVYAWRVSREKISRKPGEPGACVWVRDSDTGVTIHKAEAESAERSVRDQGQEVWLTPSAWSQPGHTRYCDSQSRSCEQSDRDINSGCAVMEWACPVAKVVCVISRWGERSVLSSQQEDLCRLYNSESFSKVL